MSIVESRYEVEAQAEPFATVAVRTGEDTKSLEPANDVFGHNALACQLPVGLFLFGRQGIILAFLVRRATVAMELVDSFVTTVTSATGLFLQRQLACLEKCKVVHIAFAKGGSQQTERAGLHYELSLAGMAFLLATVMLFLFF